MSRQIYVNLPIKDVGRSKDFFVALGWELEPMFTGEQSIGLKISDNAFVALLEESYFKTFTPKDVCDATKYTEVLVALSCESREQVDDTIERAVAAGGKVAREPQDLGFMYTQAFEDLDGHIWELGYMDPSAMDGDPSASN